jgi:hypothetical protein
LLKGLLLLLVRLARVIGLVIGLCILVGRGLGCGSGLSRWSLAMVAEVFLFYRIGNLGSLAKEVEVFSSTASNRRATVSKGIVVEGVSGLFELISKTIIRLLEVESVIGVSIVARQASKWVVSLGEARRCRVVARVVETEKGHFE